MSSSAISPNFDSNWEHFLTTVNGEFWACDLTRDSKYLVTGGQDKTVRVWDLTSAQPIKLMLSHTSNVKGVAVSCNSRYIVSGSLDKTVKLWDFTTGELLHTFTDHQNSVFAVSITENEKLAASGSQDNSVILWDLEVKVMKTRLEGFKSSVKSVKFISDSILLTGSFDKQIKVWNLQNGEVNSIPTQSRVMCVAYVNTKNLFVSGGDDGVLQVFEENSSLISTMTGHTGGIRAVEASQDGQLLVSASSDKTIRVWSLSDYSLRSLLVSHTGEINGVSLNSSSGLAASVSFDCSIKLWNLSDLAIELTSSAHTIRLSSCYEDSISIWQDLVAFGSDQHSAIIFDLASKAKVLEVFGHSSRVTSTAVRLQSLITGSADNSIKLWNVATGIQEFTFNGHSGPVTCLALSKTQALLVSGSADKTICVWDVDGKVLIRSLLGHTAGISSVDLNNDASLVVSSSMDSSVRVWNVQSGLVENELREHKEKVWRVWISNDQEFLVSASHFEFVSVFSLRERKFVQKIENLEQAQSWFYRFEEMKRKFLRYL